MLPFQVIDCVTATTMSMDSNTLTVQSSEVLDNIPGLSVLDQVRFEVTNGAQLIWEPNVEFHGPTLQTVDGGAVVVGEGSTVSFLNDLLMDGISILNVADGGSDLAQETLNGGCVYNNGDFRVGGDATFTNCKAMGGGESVAGDGGVMYVGETGSTVFNGALEMAYVSIADDDGGNGGGIFNEGKVELKGDATFESLRGGNGGALYNAAGAEFTFMDQATALFVDCQSQHGVGGALYNAGNFMFSGPASFIDLATPIIYVASTGVTVLSDNSVFVDTGLLDPVIRVATGGVLDIPVSVSFLGDVGSGCHTVYSDEDDSCPK